MATPIFIGLFYQRCVCFTSNCVWLGIDPDRPYSYDPRGESLEDDGGFDINWITISVGNISDSDDDDDDE